MKKQETSVLIISSIMGVLLISISIGSASNWAMYGHDTQNYRSTSSSAPDTSNIKWSVETGGKITSSPAVVNGYVYVGSYDHNIYCFNANTGNEKWRYETEGNVTSSPCVVNNKVFVGSNDNNVYCLDAETGQKIWIFPTQDFVTSSPAVVNNKVFVGSYDHNLYCLDATSGLKNWNYTTGAQIVSSPAISNGYVFITSSDGYIYKINTSSGQLFWKHLIGGILFSSPALVNNKVYFGSVNNPTVYCLGAIGDVSGVTSMIWSYPVDSTIQSSPAVIDGRMYINSKYYLYCLNADNGSEYWSYSAGDALMYQSSPAVAYGKVYFCSGSVFGTIFCLDSETGTEIWTYNIGEAIRSSPAIADDKLFVGSDDKKIYCFGDITLNTPDKPEGISSGIVNEIYTFSTNQIIDPNGDIVQYFFDWDDGTNSGWQTSTSKSHSWDNEGIYNVKVKARASDVESDWSEPLIVTISSPLPTLQISASSSIVEKESFTAIITSNQKLIENVQVTFNQVTKTTDEKGEVIFDAPEVTSNKIFLISASKDGYTDATKNIIILNEKEKTGWIFGTVAIQSGSIIKDAKICAKLTDGTSTSFCTQTDDDGKYVLSLSEGEYTVEVNKEGYETSSKTITIVEKTATEISFIIEKNDKQTKTSTPEENAIERLIDIEIENGNIGGNLLFEESTHSIEVFNDALNIDFDEYEKNEIIKFTIGSEELKSTIVAIKLDYGTLADLDDLKIKFDGNEISSVGFEEIFDSEQSVDSAIWTSILTYNSEGNEVAYILLKTPLSTHTITITSVIDVISGPFAILLYLIFSAIICFFVLSPLIFSPNRMYKKKKE